MAEPNRTPDGSDSTPTERDLPRTDGPATAVPASERRGVADDRPVERDEGATTAPRAADEAGRPATAAPAGERRDRDERSVPVREEAAATTRDEPTAAVPTAPAEQPVLAPAEHDAPPAPKKASNRLVGTMWVLLAAGLFEVLYFAVLALLTLLLASPAAIGPQLAVYTKTPLTWFPVLVFFLFFELTVLLFNRRGRFWYVVASLIVGLIVYFLTALFIDLSSGGSLADRNTVAQIFLTPPIVLVGLVAREVMLWTGFAIGARGKRVRRRNRAAREAYRQELAERDDRTA